MPIRPQFETDAEWLEHLRLWFAGQALAGLMSRSWDHVQSDEAKIQAWAVSAYAVADAMLAERAK